MARPEQIDQIIPSIVEHDAVSNHTFEVQRLLRELGFVSEIYASTIGPGCAGRVLDLRELPRRAQGQWVLYQCSIGSAAAEVFAAHPGRKLLDYHNITPTALVERWIPALGAETRLGREQLRELAPIVDYAFAVSAYNAAELTEAKYRTARVVPVLVDPANLDAAPDPGSLEWLRRAKSAGGSDWLFVGQLAPHKAQHDIVKAFVAYRALYDERPRLHLVGREMGSAYPAALGQFIRSLGIEDSLNIPGSVSVGELAAYYASVDVFVCLSDHEGYCAPALEAMARGLPVIAYGAGALPETVAEGGIVLERKDPAYVAAVVREVLRDADLRAEMGAAARLVAGRHSVEQARTAFRSAIAEALEIVD